MAPLWPRSSFFDTKRRQAAALQGVILDSESLEFRDVIAGGKRRCFRDGELNFKESYLEKSNRVINLVGDAE